MDAEMNAALAAGNRAPIAGSRRSISVWEVAGKVATITLDRPERKNPLTFESYAELRDLFRALDDAPDVGHRHHRRRRQLLLRRRRARDHRAAHRAGHAGPARLHRA